MKTYTYNITIHTEDNALTYSTNDVVDAIHTMVSMLVSDDTAPIEMVDGWTGELLMYRSTYDEYYATDEMGLMVMGFILALLLGL